MKVFKREKNVKIKIIISQLEIVYVGWNGYTMGYGKVLSFKHLFLHSMIFLENCIIYVKEYFSVCLNESKLWYSKTVTNNV